MPTNPETTWLVTGLGNPGDQYTDSFHNLGFRVANRLKTLHCPEGTRWEALARGRLAKAELEGKRVILLKPQTFMNLSGESVRLAADRFGIPVERIIAVHDDLDLMPCDIRLKQGGGTAGHKGLESIIAHLHDPGFVRVRVGIGRHPHMSAEKWVLSRIPGDEEPSFARAVDEAARAVRLVLALGPELAMNETNRRSRTDDGDGD